MSSEAWQYRWVGTSSYLVQGEEWYDLDGYFEHGELVRVETPAIKPNKAQ